ncbi:MAG: hypothetical protein IJ572_01835 [Bacilli bacterium]|nr:hypothetical protein [Bacilli bacterium]
MDSKYFIDDIYLSEINLVIFYAKTLCMIDNNSLYIELKKELENLLFIIKGLKYVLKNKGWYIKEKISLSKIKEELNDY